jgi:hypothetical protein
MTLTKYNGIGISGRARSGKDTAAASLHKLHPRFSRCGFADELKRVAARLIGKPDDYYFYEENKIRDRQYLINLGQTMRSYDKDFWVNKVLAQLKPGRFFVITDVRFLNEAEALKKAGFLLVRLNPSNETILERGGKLIDDPSETELDNYDAFDGYIDTGIMTPEATAKKIALAFGELPKQELYGQPFRPGDRVRVLGGIYAKGQPEGTVVEVCKNKIRMASGPTLPVIVVRLDAPQAGRVTYELRPNLVEKI